MSVRPVERITIVGAGLMGHGIAQELALAGFPVRIHDLSASHLSRAKVHTRENMERLSRMGLLDAGSIEPALERIQPSLELAEALSDADLVIEAVFENLELKQRLFEEFEQLCPADVIFASNTSSLMPGRLAERMRHPDRLVIAHYFNPPYLIPLVEIVPGPSTSEQTVKTVFSLMERIGKRPVRLLKQATGFVANRLQLALYREAISIVEQGIATPEDVDRVVRFGFGRRLAAAGPFEIFDLAGLDTIFAVASQILPEVATNEAADRPIPESFRATFERGDFGVKSGRGFREWPADAVEELRGRLFAALTRSRECEEGAAGSQGRVANDNEGANRE